MERKKVQDLILDISLTDVIYGAVFAYGFNYFDSTKNTYGYFYFIFTYALLVVDWIYTHHTYWGRNYKKIYLVLDLLVLFIFSRLLHVAPTAANQFFYWLGGLFACYAIWDFVMRLNKMEHGFRWAIALSGDVLAAALFILAGVLANLKIIGLENLWVAGASLAIYAITFSSWLVKDSQWCGMQSCRSRK